MRTSDPDYNKPYIGRFAPSPSGNLHVGSLVAALGSYLDARAHRGRWLVRIEDLDPPREVAGAAAHILHTLEHYGLCWDGPVLYQSQRHDAYREVLATLSRQGLTYHCHCSRQRIQAMGGGYDGHCRSLALPADGAALRLRQTQPIHHFHDRLQGELSVDKALAEEDFIIHRRDGLFAYNLAVVVDDHFQGVTNIVRGADLIEPTVRQLSLYHHLQLPSPEYLHLPLALTPQGSKLSKQNHAPPLPSGDPRPSLLETLHFLSQPLPENGQDLTLEGLLQWAVTHWRPERIQRNAASQTPFFATPHPKQHAIQENNSDISILKDGRVSYD